MPYVKITLDTFPAGCTQLIISDNQGSMPFTATMPGEYNYPISPEEYPFGVDNIMILVTNPDRPNCVDEYATDTLCESTIQSIDLDGTNDYINIPHNSSLNFANQPFSISAWFRADAFTNYFWFLAKGRYFDQREYVLYCRDNGALVFDIYDPDGISYIRKTQNSGELINTWYNVIATYNNNNSYTGIELYVNAVKQNDAVGLMNGTFTGYNATTHPAVIGRDFFNSTAFSNGLVHEVSLWNKALTQTDVTQIYNSGCPFNLYMASSYANLISWWRFRDQEFTNFPVMADYKGANDGTAFGNTSSALVTAAPC